MIDSLQYQSVDYLFLNFAHLVQYPHLYTFIESVLGEGILRELPCTHVHCVGQTHIALNIPVWDLGKANGRKQDKAESPQLERLHTCPLQRCMRRGTSLFLY